MPLLIELEEVFEKAKDDKTFTGEFEQQLEKYAGRPTPLYFAKNLSSQFKKEIYFKREDLLHTGAHKINNALGQALLAKRMGKQEVIAETGAGQHGVATATACAKVGIKCKIFMGKEDIRRQSSNVRRMKLLGAEVVEVDAGAKTLKDAINEALRYWLANATNTYYLLGSVVGPYPYPKIVRYFQSVIGKESRKQFLELKGKLPDTVIACVGGGSNAIGIFSGFIGDNTVELVGVEAGGKRNVEDAHSASICRGRPGIFQGTFTYLLDDDEGNIKTAHSVAAGLDYPAVGPEHSRLKESGRAKYITAFDDEALDAFFLISETEGIIPALESCHAVAGIKKLKNNSKSILVCLSGRGDKDIEEAFRLRGKSVNEQS